LIWQKKLVEQSFEQSFAEKNRFKKKLKNRLELPDLARKLIRLVLTSMGG
jgi:hypothetical protein